MNTHALSRFRRKLADDEPTVGLWVTLESPSVTEMAVALGLDWVVIDAEHGHLDWKEIVEHLRATTRGDTVALVRIEELNGALIKRALDLGADGVVVPWVESAEQLRQAVASARYPLEGRRGIGAERATAWGQAFAEHAREANENVLVVPIIETVRAAEEAARMAEVDGVEVFFFGPADFSASAGHRGQWEGPGVAERILTVRSSLRAAGKHCGLLSTDVANLKRRIEQGFRMVGLGTDTGLVIRSLRECLRALGRDAIMRADLRPPVEAPPTAASRAGTSSAASSGQGGKLRLALTADFYDTDGQPRYRDIGLELVTREPDIAVGRFARHAAEIESDQWQGAQAVLVLTPRVTARSLEGADDLVALARFGVGYDSVDVAACTERDVLLTIAAGAVDRPVAEAALTWILALAYHVPIKDRIVREGRWEDRGRYMGTGLAGRTLGIVGFGGIGRALARLVANFGFESILVYDPFLPAEQIRALGCEAAALDDLLARSDFVSVHCPLMPSTRDLIGERELGLMKPTAYLVNTARGGIVNEPALVAALEARRIAGAGIDCFVDESPAGPAPFAALDNVLLGPHAIAWTNDLFRDIGRVALTSLVDLWQGRRPRGMVNPEVFERKSFQDKLARARRGDAQGDAG